MEETKDQHHEDCCSHCHMHGMGGKYHLLRWILGLTIILLVFWLGFKLGEFKGYFDDYGYGKGFFGRGMMMNYGTDGNDYFQFRRTRNQDYVYPPMMLQQLPSTSTPSK